MPEPPRAAGPSGPEPGPQAPLGVPVLFLVYNRPEPTRRVMERIRAAAPPRLYVAADGPHPSRPGDAERCEAARSIATAVDWPCTVRVRFSDANQGCGLGESSGMSWFFEEEPEGIVLEDDTLPTASFFPFAEELLARYRDDDRVGMVTGSNFVRPWHRPRESYFFSRFPYTWGWAGWRRAWESYDFRMAGWPEQRERGLLRTVSGGSRSFERCWRRVFDDAHAGRLDTWDYQWIHALWAAGRVSVVPEVNLIENIGFGADATHTAGEVPGFVRASPPEEIRFPLRHPVGVTPDTTAERLIARKAWRISPASEARAWVRSRPLVQAIRRRLS